MSYTIEPAPANLAPANLAPHAPAAGGSALDLIGQMASIDRAQKKSGKPVVQDATLDLAVETWIEQDEAERTAKALKETSAAQIRAAANTKRLEFCTQHGEVAPSVTINGKLTCIQKNQYSEVPGERTKALKDAFGQAYSRYFKATLAIGLCETSANDEDVLTVLIAKLGAEFFQQHFAVRRNLLVQKPFHEDYCTSEAVRVLAQPFLAEQTINPYTASISRK